MSEWQVIYLSLLLSATLIGWGQWRIAAAMWANFAATMAFAHDPTIVGTVDILCAALLFGHGWRANAVGAIFIAMIPIYLIGQAFAVDNTTTYAIVDVLAYVQCAVLASGGGGLRRIAGLLGAARSRDRRGSRGVATTAARVQPAESDRTSFRQGR